MKNGFESVAQQGNPSDNVSSIHFSPSISNKTNHYYNHFFNSKKNNINPPSIIENIKYNNYSSPKYQNKMKYKNKLITNHYNMQTNKNQSSNDKKQFSMNLFRKPIITEPSCGLDKFLPNKVSQKIKTLVIDLDETLVHSYFDTNPPRKPDISFEITIDNKKLKVNTLVRPGAIEFLEKMSEIFEIVIFTASLRLYALPIINFIDKKNKCEFKLFREHCSILNNGFIKDLKKLSRDLNNLILLDNNPKCYFLNKENGIPIKTWIDDLSDKELLKITPYLAFLSNENIKDIRPILNAIKEGNTINYYKFDKIIKKYKKRQIIKNENNIIKIKYKIKNEEKVDESISNLNKNSDNINQKEEMNKENENENEINIDKYNEKNNYNNEINNCVHIEIKEENKSLNIDKKRFQNIFKNKIKSSKNYRFNICHSKNKKDISNEIKLLNNNIFDQKISLNNLNSPKNIINNSLNNFNTEVFNNKNNNSSLFNTNNTNNSRDIINKTNILPKLASNNRLKPIINSLKYSSKCIDDLKNDDICYQKSTLCNEYKYKYKNNYNMPYINNNISPMKINSQKGNILFHTLRNFKYINNINNIYSDYSKNNKDSKCDIPFSQIENNNNSKFKDNKFLLKELVFNRSNSQKNKLLYNNKPNKNDNNNNFNNLLQDNIKDYKIKTNRCLSSSKKESITKT